MTEQPSSGGPRRRRSARREAGPPAPPAPEAAPPPAPTPPAAGPVDERPTRLRKRPRRRATASPMPVTPPAPPEPAPATTPPSAGAPPGGRERRVDHTERALRGLVTTRGTQVPWSAATRARVVAAPTAEDLAEAAAEIVVVRRNYTPPEPLRPGRSGDAPRARRRVD